MLLAVLFPHHAESVVPHTFLDTGFHPCPETPILCSRNWADGQTSVEDVEILLQRCVVSAEKVIIGHSSPLFVLAFPESLRADIMEDVVKVVERYFKSPEALENKKK